MTGRPFIKTTAVAGLIMVMTGSLCAAEALSKKPNVILIMTDDQGCGDLSCHGHPWLKTPNLDKLHAEGVRLTDYRASPLRGLTRAVLLTGRHRAIVTFSHNSWTTTAKSTGPIFCT